jgi:hypothetical protein
MREGEERRSEREREGRRRTRTEKGGRHRA